MLGADLVLPGSLVRDPRLDYVALGHIHKPQDLNENAHPPVIYPGSIERVDFGEAGMTSSSSLPRSTAERPRSNGADWSSIRPFIDRRIHARVARKCDRDAQVCPAAGGKIGGCHRPPDSGLPPRMGYLIDEPALRRYAEAAFEFHLIKRPQIEARIRLPADQTVSSLSPLELLDQYWRASHTDENETTILKKLAKEIIEEE